MQQRFLYARDEKVEESQFNRILGPLISQLKYIPPQDFIPETQGYPEDLVHSDLYGNLVVETLVQMALSAENDAIWKPLHHQVYIKFISWESFCFMESQTYIHRILYLQAGDAHL